MLRRSVARGQEIAHPWGWVQPEGPVAEGCSGFRHAALLLDQATEGASKADVPAGGAGQHCFGLKPFHQFRNHLMTFDEGAHPGQTEVHHRCDHRIQWFSGEVGVEETVWFEIKPSRWMPEQIAVLHHRDRCPCTGLDAEVAHLALLSGFQAGDGLETEALDDRSGGR